MDKPSGAETFLASIGAIVIGLPFAALGLILCFSTIGIIPGAILIAISGIPLFLVQDRAVRRKVKYEWRDHPLSEEEPPWMMEDGM